MLDPDRWFTRLYFLRPPVAILDGYFNVQAQQVIRTQEAAQLPATTGSQALIQGILDDQSAQYAPTLYDQDVQALRGAFRDYIDSVYNLDGRDTLWMPGQINSSVNVMLLPVSTLYGNSESPDVFLVSQDGSLGGTGSNYATANPKGVFASGVTLESVQSPSWAAQDPVAYFTQALQTNSYQYLVRPGTNPQSLTGTVQYAPAKQSLSTCLGAGKPSEQSSQVNSPTNMTTSAFRLCYFTRPVARLDGFVNLPMLRQPDLPTGGLINIRAGGFAGQPVGLTGATGLQARFRTLEVRGAFVEYAWTTSATPTTSGSIWPLFSQTPFAPVNCLVSPVVAGFGPAPTRQAWAVQEIRGMTCLTGWSPDGVTFETMCRIPGWEPTPGSFQDYEAVPFTLLADINLRTGTESGSSQFYPITTPGAQSFLLVGIRYLQGGMWGLKLQNTQVPVADVSTSRLYSGKLQSCLIAIPLEALQLPQTPTQWSQGGGALWGMTANLGRPFMDNYARDSSRFTTPGYPSYGSNILGFDSHAPAGATDSRDYTVAWDFAAAAPILTSWVAPALQDLPAVARTQVSFRFDHVVGVDPDASRGGRFHISGLAAGQDLYGRDLAWKATETPVTSLESTLFSLKQHPALQAPQWTELDQIAVGSLLRGFRTRDASGFVVQDRTARTALSVALTPQIPYLYVSQGGRLTWVAPHLCAADRAVRKRSRILSLGCWTTGATPVNPQLERYSPAIAPLDTTFQWVTDTAPNHLLVTHSRTNPWVVFRQQYLTCPAGKILGWDPTSFGWATVTSGTATPATPGPLWCRYNRVDPVTRYWIGAGFTLPDQIGCLQGFTLAHAQFLSGDIIRYPDDGGGVQYNSSQYLFKTTSTDGSPNQIHGVGGASGFFSGYSSGFTTEVNVGINAAPCYNLDVQLTSPSTCAPPPGPNTQSFQTQVVYIGNQSSDPRTAHRVRNVTWTVKKRWATLRSQVCIPAVQSRSSISTAGIVTVQATYPDDVNARPSDNSSQGFADPGPTIEFVVTPPVGLTPTVQVLGTVGHGTTTNGRFVYLTNPSGCGSPCGWSNYSIVALVHKPFSIGDGYLPPGQCEDVFGGSDSHPVWREFPGLGPTYQFPSSDIFLPVTNYINPSPNTPGDGGRNHWYSYNGSIRGGLTPLFTGWHPNMYQRLYAERSQDECGYPCGACPVPRLLGAALPLYRPLFLSDHQPTRGYILPGLPYCPQGLTDTYSSLESRVLDGITQAPQATYWVKAGETVQFMHAGGPIATFSNLAPLVGTATQSGDLVSYQAVTPGEDVLICTDAENQVQERFMIRVFATQVVVGISNPVQMGSTTDHAQLTRATLWCLTPGAMMGLPEARAAALFVPPATFPSSIPTPGVFQAVMPAQVETFQTQEFYQVTPVTGSTLAVDPRAAGTWRFRVWEVPTTSTEVKLVFDSTTKTYRAGTTSGPQATLAYEFPYDILAVQLTCVVTGDLVTCTCLAPVEVTVGFFCVPPVAANGTQSVPYRVVADDRTVYYHDQSVQYLAAQDQDLAGRLTASADRMTWTFNMAGWNPPEAQMPGWIRVNLCARVPDTRNWFSGVPFRDFKNPWYDGSIPP